MTAHTLGLIIFLAECFVVLSGRIRVVELMYILLAVMVFLFIHETLVLHQIHSIRSTTLLIFITQEIYELYDTECLEVLSVLVQVQELPLLLHSCREED